MMAMMQRGMDIMARLPTVRGRIQANAPLAHLTWFRVGGAAEILFRPADADDLAYFLSRLPSDIPVTVIGVASNLLIRDGGVPGVVIRLGGEFARLQISGTTLRVGAGCLDLNVALAARDAGLMGLEFLSGIPGTIGGALRMNAGAYGREIKDVLQQAEWIERSGVRRSGDAAALGLSYRHCGLGDDVIFTAALLQAAPGDSASISATMQEIQAQRETTQPIKARTGGSTFANPPGMKAWELIAAAGCRGLSVGDARISEKHANFMLNMGNASAADLENLGEEVRARVLRHSGVELRWEIRRVGVSKAEALHG